VADATVPAAYRSIVRSRVSAQASYRTSFVVELVSQVFIVLVEFVEVVVVFHQVDHLGVPGQDVGVGRGGLNG
jgi:ABC-type uncharacterized transport system permease subunit